jgi:YidC/Oxa1 family membrane protein insertase
MNTRLIIAFVVSIVVIVVYQLLFFKQPPTETPKGKEAVVATKEVKPQPAEASKPIVTEQRRPRAGVTYQDIVVTTPLYTATFTTYGGRLTSWRLKEYMDRAPMHPLGKFVQDLADLVMGVFGFKKEKAQELPPQPFDMVNTKTAADAPLGLSFAKGGIGYDEGIPCIPSAGGVTLTRQGEKQTLTFRWRSLKGEQVDKSLTFYADSYRVDMEVQVSTPPNRGAIKDMLGVEWTAAVGEKNAGYGFFGPVYFANGDFKEIKPNKIKGEATAVTGAEWFGFKENYFIALIAPSLKDTGLTMQRTPEDVVRTTQLTPLELKPGGSERMTYTIFLGPKIAQLLAQITPTADKAAGYGWFTFLAVPLLKILTFTNNVTGNYGLDIIILAIFLKIIFIPLTHKSQQSMKEMQQLQPEIKHLQQKYKEDKQALNREIMELYKRRKVNPFGGCLPMLLQLPVFFALYRAFYDAIELRHSPFILWITDLADKDPTYITPLLMGATMYFQQKMTTVVADPSQAKMMSLMPIFFTFIFLNFPSGLVLYWLVTNVLGIAHQLYINKKQ